jgi:hypothetical protein
MEQTIEFKEKKILQTQEQSLADIARKEDEHSQELAFINKRMEMMQEDVDFMQNKSQKLES